MMMIKGQTRKRKASAIEWSFSQVCKRSSNILIISCYTHTKKQVIGKEMREEKEMGKGGEKNVRANMTDRDDFL